MLKAAHPLGSETALRCTSSSVLLSLETASRSIEMAVLV
jgi:hypothetical protein